MGKLLLKYFNGDNIKVYTCSTCGLHLSTDGDIHSKNFRCASGSAYLFDKVINVEVGFSEQRMLLTGMHEVADVNCKQCGEEVGWTYLNAHETDQKYKIGKTVLERMKLSVEVLREYKPHRQQEEDQLISEEGKIN